MEIAQEEGCEQTTGDMDGMDMMNQNELDAEMDIAMNAGEEENQKKEWTKSDITKRQVATAISVNIIDYIAAPELK